MEDIATTLRFMQFYAHKCHNEIAGNTFFQDHEFLGELYPVYDSNYDSVIERCIGLGKEINISKVNKDAAELLDDKVESPEECFKMLLIYEKHLCDLIKEEIPSSSPGTEQMLGTFADESEVRQYKLKQRMGK